MGGANFYAYSPTLMFSCDFSNVENMYFLLYLNRFPDCVGLTSMYEIAMLQDESLKLLSESSGSPTRMGHILLTLPYIRSIDRKVIEVIFLSIYCRFLI